jgi:DNA-binding response OmpR family regulator
MGNGRAVTVEMDLLNRRVRLGALTIHLTGVEQSLLYLLVMNAGKVVTLDEIQKAIWGPTAVLPSNVIGRHMCALRAKLHDDSQAPRFIATVRGQGYRFVPGGVEGASPPSFIGLPALLA